MHRDEAGERRDEGTERKRRPHAKMLDSRRRREEQKGGAEQHRMRGGMTVMGGGGGAEKKRQCFFFFAESLQLTSLEVWRMACLSWDLLVRAAFVLPFPFCLAGFCDPLSFTGPNVVIAVSFCAGSPSQETAASLLPECFSRVCGLEGILQPGSTAKREFQPAGGRFITFAVC